MEKTKFSKYLLKYSIGFLSIMAFYCILMIAICALPRTDRFDNNLKSSAEMILYDEGSYPKRFGVGFDNITDSLMQNIVWHSSYGNPFKTAFANYFYYGGTKMITSTYDAISENIIGKVQYSHYWHGYMIFLKPLMYFYDYSQIRIIYSYVFYTLFALCAIFMYKHVNIKLSLAFLFSVIMVDIHVLPMSTQFTTMFFVTFISILIIFAIRDKKIDNIYMCFAIIGSATMFFDFYTYAFLSLGMPLMCYLAYKLQKGMSVKRALTISLICVGLWFAGYVCTWLVKNFIAVMLFGGWKFFNLFASVKKRLGRSDVFIEALKQSLDTILLCFRTILKPVAMQFVCSIMGLWLVLFVFFREKGSVVLKFVGLLIVFLIPLIWYAVAVNPTQIHYGFQYRGITICFMVAFYFFFSSIDYKKAKTYINNIKNRTVTLFKKKDSNTDNA